MEPVSYGPLQAEKSPTYGWDILNLNLDNDATGITNNLFNSILFLI